MMYCLWIVEYCISIRFYIHSADDKSCSVQGEVYNPARKFCECGSAGSCTGLGNTKINDFEFLLIMTCEFCYIIRLFSDHIISFVILCNHERSIVIQIKIIFWGVSIEGQYFVGWCRYGSDERDWIHALTIDSSFECKQECIAVSACTAFSYDEGGTNNCNLYRNGPYTYGDGRESTKCYVMARKMHCICYILINIIIYTYIYILCISWKACVLFQETNFTKPILRDTAIVQQTHANVRPQQNNVQDRRLVPKMDHVKVKIPHHNKSYSLPRI